MKNEVVTKKVRRKKRKALVMAVCTQLMILGKTVAVFAGNSGESGGGGTGISTTTGIPQIDSVLTAIKAIFLGIIALIGVIILAKGIADTAQAYQQQDSHGMYDGAKGIAAGAIMAFISAVLTLLGL
ncbi:MAG: electron transporter RnfA [Eubacterium sp.]|nr:electron transporter RnfA [Eubacterium sp.]